MPHNHELIDQFTVISYLAFEAIAAGDQHELTTLFEERAAVLSQIDPRTLDEACRRKLADADANLRRRIAELQSEFRRDFARQRQRRSGRSAYARGSVQPLARSA